MGTEPAGGTPASDDDALSRRIGRNVRDLRIGRGFTQQKLARAVGLPRATWAHVESGAANPTIRVLERVARALSVSLEELVAEPRAACQHYPAGSLPVMERGAVSVRKLLPDRIAGMELERLHLPVGAQLTGVPHMAGTREYLACESGTLLLVAAGEQWKLAPGDVVVFRGDQRHSYRNVGTKAAVGYSVVVLAG